MQILSIIFHSLYRVMLGQLVLKDQLDHMELMYVQNINAEILLSELYRDLLALLVLEDRRGLQDHR